MDMEAEMLAIRVMHLFFHQTDVVACRDRKYLGSFWQLTNCKALKQLLKTLLLDATFVHCIIQILVKRWVIENVKTS